MAKPVLLLDGRDELLGAWIVRCIYANAYSCRRIQIDRGQR